MRGSGLAAALGGAMWVAVALAAAARPAGCVGAVCAYRPMRDTTGLTPLVVAAVTLVAVGIVGLVVHARRTGRFGRTLRAGLALVAAGGGILGAAVVVQAIFYGGDFPYMPHAVLPGALAVAAGTVLVGVAVLPLLSRSSSLLLLAGGLAFALSNDQDARVLLTAPLGAAWLAVGRDLWLRGGAGGRRAS